MKEDPYPGLDVNDLLAMKNQAVDGMNELDRKLGLIKKGHHSRNFILIERAKLVKVIQDTKAGIVFKNQTPKKPLPPVEPHVVVPRAVVGPVRVSDHAIVRWLQRVHGLDMEKVREQVVPKIVLDAVALRFQTDAWVLIYQGVAYVARSNTIMTVIDTDAPEVSQATDIVRLD